MTESTTKKTKATTTATAAKKEAVAPAKDNDEIEKLKSENETLKSQFETLQSQFMQMSQMMQQMSMMGQFGASAGEQKDIEVTSLTAGQLLLTTNGQASGRHYDFNNQFDSLLIPEDDLKQIIKAMPQTTEGGAFFINDEEFIRKNGLTSVYRTLMNQDKIRDFFIKPYQEAMEIYENANKVQRDIIETMVSDKCLNGEFVDANILKELSKNTGKDFMVIEPLETTKEV